MVNKNNKIIKKQASGTDKQWLLVSQETQLYFKALKKEIREKCGVSITYDKLVTRMIKDFNKNKYVEELKKFYKF